MDRCVVWYEILGKNMKNSATIFTNDKKQAKNEVIDKYKRSGMEVKVTKVIYYGETE